MTSSAVPALSRPTLTAAIANYNHARTLPRAIEAMLSQTRPPDELIVIDDASTDDSRAVIERYAARSPLVRPLFRERNGGFNAAITQALSAAKFTYFYPGGADDYVEPTFFAEAMAAAERSPQAGLIYGRFTKVTSDGQRSSGWGRSPMAFRHLQPTEAVDEFFIRADPLSSPSPATMYRRECMLAVGGYREELASYSDSFQILTIAARYGALAIPVDCAVMFWEPTGFSGRTSRSLRKMSSLVRRSAELFRTEFADCVPSAVVERWELLNQRSVVESLVDLTVDYAPVLACDTAVRAGLARWSALGLMGYRKLLSFALLAYQRRLRQAMVRVLTRGTPAECEAVWQAWEAAH